MAFYLKNEQSNISHSHTYTFMALLSNIYRYIYIRFEIVFVVCIQSVILMDWTCEINFAQIIWSHHMFGEWKKIPPFYVHWRNFDWVEYFFLLHKINKTNFTLHFFHSLYLFHHLFQSILYIRHIHAITIEWTAYNNSLNSCFCLYQNWCLFWICMWYNQMVN